MHIQHVLEARNISPLAALIGDRAHRFCGRFIIYRKTSDEMNQTYIRRNGIKTEMSKIW